VARRWPNSPEQSGGFLLLLAKISFLASRTPPVHCGPRRCPRGPFRLSDNRPLIVVRTKLYGIQLSQPEGPNKRSDIRRRLVAPPECFRKRNCAVDSEANGFSTTSASACQRVGGSLGCVDTSESHVSHPRDRAHCTTFVPGSLCGQGEKCPHFMGLMTLSRQYETGAHPRSCRTRFS
jgi:hypothetical protein